MTTTLDLSVKTRSIDGESTVREQSEGTVRHDGATTERPRPTVEQWKSEFKLLPVRLPADLVPTASKRFDAQEMEDWVIGSYICNHMRLWQTSPCLQSLQYVSGRSHRTVRATVLRLIDKGWLGGAKARNEFAPGQFGLKWRLWVPNDSPLRPLLDHKPGDGFNWVAVPGTVARYRSILAVGAYLVLQKQMHKDGAIVTTPTDIAGLLHCDRTTAWRVLRFVGARAATEPRSGHVVYTMPTVYSPSITLMDYHGEVVTVPIKLKDKMRARLDTLRGVLKRACIDDVHELQETFRELHQSDASRCPSAALVLRVLEERNRRVLASHKTYGLILSQRFGWRIKGLRSGAFKVKTYDDTVERSEVREDLRSALSRALCDVRGCEDGWIDVPQDDGTHAATRCHNCST